MIKALLFHFGKEATLLRFLPSTWEKEIELLAPPQSLDFVSMLSLTKWLKYIHYSWLYPPLAELPQKTQGLFFPLFSQKQQKGLSEMLQFQPKSIKLSPFITYYLADFLKNKVQKEDVIPLSALPKSTLNPLIKVKWSALMNLIDYLGLYDLACDFKQIVDKTLIRKIFAALPKEHGDFVRYASKQPIKWVSPKLTLQNWDGDPQKLKRLLHQRGLIRLARGVSGEHLSFRWHLIHRLDVQRAKVISEALTQPIDREQFSLFKNQILHIAKMVIL